MTDWSDGRGRGTIRRTCEIFNPNQKMVCLSNYMKGQAFFYYAQKSIRGHPILFFGATAFAWAYLLPDGHPSRRPKNTNAQV